MVNLPLILHRNLREDQEAYKLIRLYIILLLTFLTKQKNGKPKKKEN